MLGESPERFLEEERRLGEAFAKLDCPIDFIDEFLEKNASPEYLQFLKEEDERLAALEALGIMAV